MTGKIIVLDRDGVINQDSDEYIKTADEWVPLPGSIEAIAYLKQAGWTVAVATNQSGLPRGYFTRVELNRMHQKLQALLSAFDAKVDWISYAPYLSEDASDCRKPATGMLRAIEQRFGGSLKGAPMVGDTLADVKAATTHGMKPYLVRTGKGMRTLLSQDAALNDVPVFDNLLLAVEAILK